MLVQVALWPKVAFTYAGKIMRVYSNVFYGARILQNQTLLIVKLSTFPLNVCQLQKFPARTIFISLVTLIARKFALASLGDWTLVAMIINAEYKIILVVSI